MEVTTLFNSLEFEITKMVGETGVEPAVRPPHPLGGVAKSCSLFVATPPPAQNPDARLPRQAKNNEKDFWVKVTKPVSHIVKG